MLPCCCCCAWYLLNESRAPWNRRLYLPEEWFYCQDWKSIGQRESMQEWEVRARAELMRRTCHEQERGARRMRVIQQQVQMGMPVLPALQPPAVFQAALPAPPPAVSQAAAPRSPRPQL